MEPAFRDKHLKDLYAAFKASDEVQANESIRLSEARDYLHSLISQAEVLTHQEEVAGTIDQQEISSSMGGVVTPNCDEVPSKYSRKQSDSINWDLFDFIQTGLLGICLILIVYGAVLLHQTLDLFVIKWRGMLDVFEAMMHLFGP